MTKEEIFKPLIIHCLENEVGFSSYRDTLIFDLTNEKFPAIKRVLIKLEKTTTYDTKPRRVKGFFFDSTEFDTIKIEHKSFSCQLTSTEAPECTDHGGKWTNPDIWFPLPEEELKTLFDKAYIKAESNRAEITAEHVRKKNEKYQLMVDNTIGK